MALKIELAANANATAWTDITGEVDITSIRFGGRAANGESEQCGFNLQDDAAIRSLPAHRIVRAVEDATTPDTTIGWGRVQSADIGRGKLFNDDARAFDVQLTDPNGELRGVTFTKISRPAETPSHRMRGIVNRYLGGVGTFRRSTDLNYTTYVPLLAFVNMPKKVYPLGKIEDVLNDIADTHALLYFVTMDRQMFLAQQTSTIYASTIAISDAGDDDGETIFAPIFEGTANSQDMDQQLSGIKVGYGSGRYVAIRRGAAEAAGDRWEDVINVDTTSKASATNKGNSTLDLHAAPESAIRCKLLMRADQVDLIKHGMTLAFRAAAAGILSPLTFRIASLVWEWAGPGHYLASLELNFPRKVKGTINHPPAPAPLPPFQPNAGTITYIQSGKTVDGAADGNATLGAAPTAGHLLVAVTEPDQPGAPVVPWDYLMPAGWVTDEAGDVVVAGTNLGHLIASKASDGSETSTDVRWGPVPVTGAVSPNGMLIVAEYDTGDAIPTVSQVVAPVLQDVGGGATTTPAITLAPGATGLIVWLVGFRPNYAPTVSAGWNIRQSWDSTGGSRLRLMLVDRIVTNASGAYSATLTSPGGADSNGWVLMAAVYEIEPGQPLPGQRVPAEQAGVGTGAIQVITTNYPYAPGSVQVLAGNPGAQVIVAAAETDPAAGTITGVFPVGAPIVVLYQGTGDDPTGAANPPVTPSGGVDTLPTDVIPATLVVGDEGVALAGAATALDFVGGGVTATGGAGTKTITIPGGSTGAAGGDLSGTYPNPTVAKVNGVAVTGVPAADDVIRATGPTAAAWDGRIWKPVMDGSGNVVTDSGTGAAIMTLVTP